MKGGPGRRDDPEKGNSTGRRKREKIGRFWRVKNIKIYSIFSKRINLCG
jgi:hypothetical protein